MGLGRESTVLSISSKLPWRGVLVKISMVHLPFADDILLRLADSLIEWYFTPLSTLLQSFQGDS